ncbi:MAG: RNA polymerase sigma factor [Chloroflexota bacterium]
MIREWMNIHQSTATSFDELFMQEYGRVVAIAARVMGNDTEAEDVAQDVFSSYYSRHPADASYARSWLHRAAVHTALNTIRGWRRRDTRETRDMRQRERILTHQELALDPQVALEISEERQIVRTALAALPEKSASVLALRYSGLSYTEVADALGVNAGQIGTLLRRAETALRKELTHETSR